MTVYSMQLFFLEMTTFHDQMEGMGLFLSVLMSWVGRESVCKIKKKKDKWIPFKIMAMAKFEWEISSMPVARWGCT